MHYPDEIITLWLETCKQVKVDLSPEQILRIKAYHKLLIHQNQTMNLIRLANGLDDFLYRHVLDSLVLNRHINNQETVLDIGSGAGFPAIPLAITRPELSITAVESIKKKALFLATCKEKLALANLTVCNARAETLAKTKRHREKYQVITARAVAKLPVLLEWAAPLTAVGGVCLMMKGKKYSEELDDAEKIIQALGLSYEKAIGFNLPQLVGSKILLFQKTVPTDLKYPRHSSKSQRG